MGFNIYPKYSFNFKALLFGRFTGSKNHPFNNGFIYQSKDLQIILTKQFNVRLKGKKRARIDWSLYLTFHLLLYGFRVIQPVLKEKQCFFRNQVCTPRVPLLYKLGCTHKHPRLSQISNSSLEICKLLAMTPKNLLLGLESWLSS